MQWKCPVCHQRLQLGEHQASCVNQHQFDRAKQGYYNLLLANQKRSKNPGDDRQMILARQQFLHAGHYDHLAQLLETTLMQCADERSSLHVLDSGCGEGYFTQRMAAALRLVCPFADVAGSDISRDALKLASKTAPSLAFVIASSMQLPIMDHSLDVIIRNFAPGYDDEIHRVLKPGGCLIIAAPGPSHLIELKQALYDDVRPHESPEPPAGFDCISQEHTQRLLQLDSNVDIHALLAMTPFAWRGKREGRELLRQQQTLTVTTEFHVACFQKRVD